MTHLNEITLLIAVIALALWPVVLFILRFWHERRKQLEHIERMTKDELDEITTKDLVISVLKKIGCQPKVNEEITSPSNTKETISTLPPKKKTASS